MKEFLRLFIPPIYYRIKNKIFKDDIVYPKLNNQHTRTSQKLLIIGNGPSLNESIEKYFDVFDQYEKLSVNFFSSSELYTKIKPDIYVMVDPLFFKNKENIGEAADKVIHHLKNDTNWSLHVVLPVSAKESYLVEQISNNSCITVGFYNDRNYPIGNMSKFEAWDHNYLLPPSQNVLNVCTYLALFWNYPETYIIGADTTFVQNLVVDQETNEIFSLERHFYNNDSVYSSDPWLDKKSRRRKVNNKMHEELNCIKRALENYWTIRDYADYKGLKIYNASEYSWIDAFERRKLT